MENNNKQMSSSLKTKILIGALAVTTATAIVVPTVMALTKPTSPINPTYFSVALNAGEGTFGNDQQILLVSNVVSGTPLNQVEGYVLPTKDVYYVFDHWYNDKHEIIAPDTPITQNLALTASYVEGIELYREKYFTQINEEIQHIVDYAIGGQFEFDGYNIYDAMDEMKTLSSVLKSPNITSINMLTKIFQLIHEYSQAIDRVPVDENSYPFVSLSPYYHQLMDACRYDINKIQDAQNDSQIEASYLLARNHLTTYCSEQPELVNEICQKYYNDAKNATNEFDLAVATKIGGGLIRGGCYLKNIQEHDDVSTIIMNKLNSAKESITDPEKLIAFIDFLGDCASAYCKIIQLEKPADTIKTFEKLYTKAINSFVSTSTIDSYRYQMISSLLNGISYSAIIGLINEESQLLDSIENLIKDKQLSVEQVKDIKEIVANAAEVLKNSNDHTTATGTFITQIVLNCIDKYLETPEFLEFVLYAMQIEKLPIPQDDVFIKEGGSGDLNWKDIVLFRLTIPLNVAYTYYKEHLDTALTTDSLDAFKIVVKGIIKSTIYSSKDDYRQNKALTECQKIIGDFSVMSLFTSGSKSTKLSYAYLIANIPTLYTYVTCVINDNNFVDNIFSSFDDKFTDGGVGKLFDFLGSEKDAIRAIELGKLAGSNLGLNFVRFAEPLCQLGDFGPDKLNAAWSDITGWNNRFKEMSPFAHTDESFEAIKNAVGSTALSSRIYHFDKFKNWAYYTNQYSTLRDNYLNNLINIIFNSSNSNQIIKRSNIYVNRFLNILNQWCGEKDALDIDELFNEVKAEMEAVQ